MNTSSSLFYYSTDIEIQEGDYIEFTSLFTRKKKLGRVSYIPKYTAIELQKSGKQPDDWLIQFDDGTVTGWLYHPEETKPISRLHFIKRKDDSFKGITSEELEQIDN